MISWKWRRVININGRIGVARVRWREREISKSPPFFSVGHFSQTATLINPTTSLDKSLKNGDASTSSGLLLSSQTHDCIKYLSCKVDDKKELSCEGLIFERDPYNPKELPDIFLAAETRENLYLFTKLQRKGRPGSVHINRTIGKGKGKSTWHGDQTKEVWDADNISVFGTARTFTYREKGSINNHRFLMTEYQLLPTHGGYDPLKDHVLCHIRCPEGKKANKSNNRNSGSKLVPLLMSDAPVQVQNGPQLSPAKSKLMVEFPSFSSIPVDAPSYSLQTLASPEEDCNVPDSHLAVDWNDWANWLEYKGITGDEEQQDDNEGVLQLCSAAPVSATFVGSPTRAFESRAVHDPVTPEGDNDVFDTVTSTTMDFESPLNDDFDWNSISDFFSQELPSSCYNSSMFHNQASFTS